MKKFVATAINFHSTDSVGLNHRHEYGPGRTHGWQFDEGSQATGLESTGRTDANPFIIIISGCLRLKHTAVVQGNQLNRSICVLSATTSQ